MTLRLPVLLIALGIATSAIAEERHNGNHHPTGNAPLMAFHDLMEPLWHAPPGKQTSARGCTQADEIIRRAKEAAVRPSPDHAALVNAAQTLKKNCTDQRLDEVQKGLDQLHGIFHRLAGMR